jgi:hypothetical protein
MSPDFSSTQSLARGYFQSTGNHLSDNEWEKYPTKVDTFEIEISNIDKGCVEFIVDYGEGHSETRKMRDQFVSIFSSVKNLFVGQKMILKNKYYKGRGSIIMELVCDESDPDNAIIQAS